MAYADGASAIVSDAEQGIHLRCVRGDFRGAVEAALRRYGPELLGFLCSVHRCADDAHEVFSRVSEKLLESLPNFAWRSSLRTYLYILARSQSARFRRDEARRHARTVPLSECSAAWQAPVSGREPTLSCLKSQGPHSLAELRKILSLEDRMLLVLRVDRGLPWAVLAEVFLGDMACKEALERECARLRQRFQIIRARLLKEGRRRGVFGTQEPQS